jgi:hypothetical protein
MIIGQNVDHLEFTIMKSNDLYLIDFWGGSHGHFLEYVVNCWIFGIPRVENLFNENGACHGAKGNREYQHKSFVRCGHYSQFDVPIDHNNKVIRIIIDDFLGYCCYQINVIHRAGDIPKSQKELFIPADTRNNPVALRMDYYSKFMMDEHGWPIPDRWKFQDCEILEINMVDLYDFVSFMSLLRKIADFFKSTFVPDSELVAVWQEFMHKNQGWNTWILCKEILKDIISGNERIIDLEIEQQALLNVMLSKICSLHDGKLFFDTIYPNNTIVIHEIINEHLTNFDSRFLDID